MNPRLKQLRDINVNRILGIDLRANEQAFRDFVAAQTQRELEIAGELQKIKSFHEDHLAAIRVQFDDIKGTREDLAAMRADPDYERVFADDEPLISVRIASYSKTTELVEVALASVFAQTYENYEVVIVNDGPNETTRRALEKLNHPKVRFEELPWRSAYPDDAHKRWMVAGTAPANHGDQISRGSWIAPLDDDDEFTPDHLEKLLRIALRERAELSYGALIQKNLVNGDDLRIWSWPPAISQFSFQGALHLRALRCVPYHDSSWILGEPGDWNRIRRMKESGVRMAMTEDVVATMNMIPYTHKESE